MCCRISLTLWQIDQACIDILCMAVEILVLLFVLDLDCLTQALRISDALAVNHILVQLNLGTYLVQTLLEINRIFLRGWIVMNIR